MHAHTHTHTCIDIKVEATALLLKAKLVWIGKQTSWEDNEQATCCLLSQFCCYPTGLSCCVCSCANVFKRAHARMCEGCWKTVIRISSRWPVPLQNLVAIMCAHAWTQTNCSRNTHTHTEMGHNMWLTALITASASYVRHHSSQMQTHMHSDSRRGDDAALSQGGKKKGLGNACGHRALGVWVYVCVWQ